MKIRTVVAMGLLLTMLGCSKLTLENYSMITAGMSYDEVTQLICPPDECDDVMGVRNCLWGDEKRSVNVSFVAGKALLFSSSNLQQALPFWLTAACGKRGGVSLPMKEMRACAGCVYSI